MGRLVFISDGFEAQTHELVAEVTTVGRADYNALTVRDPSVSADHCLILAFGPEVIVRERGSLNGTFVEGKRVEGQSVVKSGQTIRFGAIEARLQLDEADLHSDRDEDTTIWYKQLKAEALKRQSTPGQTQPLNSELPPRTGPDTATRLFVHKEPPLPRLDASVRPHPSRMPKLSDAQWRFWFFAILAAGLALATFLYLLLRSWK